MRYMEVANLQRYELASTSTVGGKRDVFEQLKAKEIYISLPHHSVKVYATTGSMGFRHWLRSRSSLIIGRTRSICVVLPS